MPEITDIEVESSLVLRNLEQHLVGLAADTGQISKTVSELTAGLNATLLPSTIRGLQKLDSLQQSLADAAKLCSALAGPSEMRDEALAGLKLKATRALVQKTPSESCKSQGSVDIF